MVGFEGCRNLSDCSSTVTAYGGSYTNCSFKDCKNLVHCNASISETSTNLETKTYGFYNCDNLLNCKATALSRINYGFASCDNLVNCDGNVGESAYRSSISRTYYSCTMLLNCTGKARSSAADSYQSSNFGVFCDCQFCSNCSGSSPSQSIPVWNGTNTNVDFQTCPEYVDPEYVDHEYHIFYDDTKPKDIYGGDWEELAQGTFLEAAGSGYTAGASKSAGLPNLTGEFRRGLETENTTSLKGYTSGVLIPGGGSQGSRKAMGNSSSNYQGYPSITFDASRGGADPIYGKSSTVQPKSITSHIWKRKVQ